MCLEVGGVDECGLVVGGLLSQPHQDLGKYAYITPALPAIV